LLKFIKIHLDKGLQEFIKTEKTTIGEKRALERNTTKIQCTSTNSMVNQVSLSSYRHAFLFVMQKNEKTRHNLNMILPVNRILCR